MESSTRPRDTAWAMSQENVEIVRAVMDGWLRGDPAALELISEDVVYVAPPNMPRVSGGTYRGHDGVLQWVVDWRQEWNDYELDIERIEDLGDQVLTIERNRATGKRSSVGVDMQTVHLWTLRDGKVVRWQGYERPEEALEAAGLRE
jgi:ketosteroid isomerase-like protein